MNLDTIPTDALADELTKRLRAKGLATIIKKTAEIWGVLPSEILGKSITEKVSQPRAAAILLIADTTPLSHKEIAEALGRPYPCAIGYSIAKAKKLLETNKDFQTRFLCLTEAIPDQEIES